MWKIKKFKNTKRDFSKYNFFIKKLLSNPKQRIHQQLIEKITKTCSSFSRNCRNLCDGYKDWFYEAPASAVIPMWLIPVALVITIIDVDKISSIKELGKILLDRADTLAIFAALILYYKEARNRKSQERYEAWQVINSALGQQGSGGRIQALQALNQSRESLESLSVPDANLTGIKLPGAILLGANLQKAKLDKADLREANLSGANLEGAMLIKANLQGAQLWDTNLRRAQLTQSELQGAILQGANLSGAVLLHANLEQAKYLDDQLNQAILCKTKLRDGTISDRDCKQIGIDY